MKKTALVLFVFALTISVTHAQTKFGVVGVDEVFSQMPDLKKADSLLAVFQKELQDTYQQQQTALNDAYNKFVADSGKMTPSLKEIKRKDLQDRITALSKKEEEFNKLLDQEKEKAMKPVREKLMKTIQDVAKENGYTHVAYKEQLIVFPAADDITDKVKKKLGIK
jgi:outer membrane protein